MAWQANALAAMLRQQSVTLMRLAAGDIGAGGGRTNAAGGRLRDRDGERTGILLNDMAANLVRVQDYRKRAQGSERDGLGTVKSARPSPAPEARAVYARE